MTTNRRKPVEIYDQPEHRAIPLDRIEFRDDQGGNDLILEGYASTFEPYEMYGGPANNGWIEQLDKRAFDKTLKEKPDLHLLINHAGMPLARTKSGNLELSTDDHGLKVRATLDKRDPEVQSLAVKMERGDMDEMSFAFRVKGQEWRASDEFPDDPEAHRMITEVSLHKGDVSVVNWGANPTTHAGVRSAADALKYLASCDESELVEARGADASAWEAVLKRGIAGESPKINIETLNAINGLDFGIRHAGQIAGTAVRGLLETLPTGTPLDGVLNVINATTFAEDRADDPQSVVAALDAVIDEACGLTADIDRETVEPNVGQGLDLLAAAGVIVKQLMEMLSITDPDDEESDEESNEELSAGSLDWLTRLSDEDLTRAREILGIQHVSQTDEAPSARLAMALDA